MKKEIIPNTTDCKKSDAKRVKSFDKTRIDENRNILNVLTESATVGVPVNLTKILATLTNNGVCRSIFGEMDKTGNDEIGVRE
ncbi:hypothetical protein ZOSMA_41G01150 [Zostera marina]|uniref:Uncharacterized protein n=1 Tax=Zostera marina TaxID=29655 RepID=A0A0K9P4X0_ZOSMR|nr:hypothetical protein ZOSMA_41G01150 [Zostera marina]